MHILILALAVLIPGTAYAQKIGKDVELNLFLLGYQYANAESLNKYVDEFNGAGTTTKNLDKVKTTGFIAAEILGVTDWDFGYGLRYSAIATSSTGRQVPGGDVELTTGLIDFSAVFKFMSAADKFQYGAGLTIGMTSTTAIITKALGNTTVYTASAQPVARGLLLGRFNFGRFALHGEGGYLYAKVPEFKADSVKLTKADGSNVELDMSGAYISIGLGWQF
ncbi:MAG: hypothetical protein ABL958_07465 [Bdellovibrionia bacterium]